MAKEHTSIIGPTITAFSASVSSEIFQASTTTTTMDSSSSTRISNFKKPAPIKRGATSSLKKGLEGTMSQAKRAKKVTKDKGTINSDISQESTELDIPQELKNIGIKTSHIKSICGYNKSSGMYSAFINFFNTDTILAGFSRFEELKFKVSNFSSMLHGAGTKYESAINSLLSTTNIENLALLLKIQDGGKQFKPSNISSILFGAGGNIGKAIETLVESKELLIALMQGGFSGKNISSMLYGAGSGGKLGDAIGALVAGKVMWSLSSRQIF